MQQFLEYSDEVYNALQQQKPILALESTLITHGLPYPYNIETALAVEKMARDQNVVPATIAIMQGKIKIGLNSAELEALIEDKHSIKVSRRDIPYALSQKLNAGTTVAATMFCAHKAGISLFSTGGIGGVHRGNDLDISADLIELSRLPVGVICSGAKSILDLPKTIELLETLSIPVIGYQTTKLPAFYSRETAIKLPTSVNTISELGDLLHIHWQLNPTIGALITNPIPNQYEIPYDVLEPVIIKALQKAAQTNISGKFITPFLLNELVAATEGSSLETNIHLIKHNVQLGIELARCMHEVTLPHQKSSWQSTVVSL